MSPVSPLSERSRALIVEVAKALQMEAWSLRDVEIVATHGAPEVRLAGTAAQRAAELGVEVEVSLTHTRRDAAAVAITRTTGSRAPS